MSPCRCRARGPATVRTPALYHPSRPGISRRPPSWPLARRQMHAKIRMTIRTAGRIRRRPDSCGRSKLGAAAPPRRVRRTADRRVARSRSMHPARRGGGAGGHARPGREPRASCPRSGPGTHVVVRPRWPPGWSVPHRPSPAPADALPREPGAAASGPPAHRRRRDPAVRLHEPASRPHPVRPLRARRAHRPGRPRRCRAIRAASGARAGTGT